MGPHLLSDLGDTVQAIFAVVPLALASAGGTLAIVHRRALRGRLLSHWDRLRPRNRAATIWAAVAALTIVLMCCCFGTAVVNAIGSLLEPFGSVPLGWAIALLPIAAGVLAVKYLDEGRADHRLAWGAAALLVLATVGLIALGGTAGGSAAGIPAVPAAGPPAGTAAGADPQGPLGGMPLPEQTAPTPLAFASEWIVLPGARYATTPICATESGLARQLGVTVGTPLAVELLAPGAALVTTEAGRTATAEPADLGPCAYGVHPAPTLAFLSPGGSIVELDGSSYELDDMTWVQQIAVVTDADGHRSQLVWHRDSDATYHTGWLVPLG